MGRFGPKINTFELLPKFFSLDFSDMYLMAGKNEWVKVTVLNFLMNIYIILKMEYMSQC